MNAAERTGANIRKARDAEGWSQEELAERADVHPRLIPQYEDGRMHPRPGTLRTLARVLGMSPGDLRGAKILTEHDDEAITAVTERFGRNVAEHRFNAGLSVRDLSRASDLHRNSVEKIEGGSRSVRLLTLIALADALGVGPCDLLRGLRP